MHREASMDDHTYHGEVDVGRRHGGHVDANVLIDDVLDVDVHAAVAGGYPAGPASDTDKRHW